MLRNLPAKGLLVSFIVFAIIFGSHGNWAGGLACWIVAAFVMPISWRNL